MEIYTSYFGNYRNFGDLMPISISLYSPCNFNGIKYVELAPTKDILALKDNSEEYAKKFNQMLAKKTSASIYKQLQLFSHNKDVVLLCYEKPPQFCHRHLVANWLENTLGIKVKEIKFNK